MGINLQLLGLQAISRLAERFDVELDGFLGFLDLYGSPLEEFRKALDNCGRILKCLFKESDVSWWDVYLNSDIGMERMALARDIGLEKDDIVLDVGCGRGYFTVAAARCAGGVIGLDAMNGMSRHGWWKNFRESVFELKLARKIRGLKADARFISLEDCSIDKAVAVHCVRNFGSKQAIQNALCEMNRTVSKEGEIIIVETSQLQETRLKKLI